MFSPVELEELAEIVALKVSERLANRSRLLSREEIAEVIGVSVTTVDRLKRDGEIPAMKIAKRTLYDPKAVIEALSQTAND